MSGDNSSLLYDPLKNETMDDFGIKVAVGTWLITKIYTHS